jgi:hypothetical protein
MNNADNFDDLNALRLPPEGEAAAKSSADALKRARPRRAPIGEFYLCPVAWGDRAASAVASKDQLIIAFRLYRFSREKKRRTIQRLQAAGILEVVTHQAPRAPRIRIIE